MDYQNGPIDPRGDAGEQPALRAEPPVIDPLSSPFRLKSSAPNLNGGGFLKP